MPSQSWTKRRTYSREQWESAQESWRSGGFSDEWRTWRHLAAMEAGIIAAPEGTKWDQWGDDQPSERAMVVRAIRETPRRLETILRSGRVHSWAQVVRELLIDRDEDYRDAIASERRERAPFRSSTPEHIGGSLAVVFESLMGRKR